MIREKNSREGDHNLDILSISLGKKSDALAGIERAHTRRPARSRNSQSDGSDESASVGTREYSLAGVQDHKPT
jgi:hypothetical protein